MRVVAGEFKGRRLRTSPGERTRPTTDRVRESIFNALGSMQVVEGARVLDAFAGSGALGIEAVSRGAAHATFVEVDRQALAAVRANVDDLGLADRATVVRGDALGHLAESDRPYDLVLCDPPYAFDRWDELLALVPQGVVVIESDRDVVVPDGWRVLRSRRTGATVVTFVSRT